MQGFAQFFIPAREAFYSFEAIPGHPHISSCWLLQGRNFTFKCHRDGSDVYPVNSISFHPTFGTFVTTGGDGGFTFWDKDSKQRLKGMQRSNQPIPCGTFNKDGTIYAYAVSYDWSRGCNEYNPQNAKNYILLHSPQESEVQKRPAAARPGSRR